MLVLCAVMVALVLAGCGEPASDTPRSAPQPAAAVQANCRFLYPRHPDLAEACVQRWTTGAAMPGPSIEPLPFQSDTEQALAITHACVALAGIPVAKGQRMTPTQFTDFAACFDAEVARRVAAGTMQAPR
jgi:hypothetical protein